MNVKRLSRTLEMYLCAPFLFLYLSFRRCLYMLFNSETPVLKLMPMQTTISMLTLSLHPIVCRVCATDFVLLFQPLFLFVWLHRIVCQLALSLFLYCLSLLDATLFFLISIYPLPVMYAIFGCIHADRTHSLLF